MVTRPGSDAHTSPSPARAGAAEDAGAEPRTSSRRGLEETAGRGPQAWTRGGLCSAAQRASAGFPAAPEGLTARAGLFLFYFLIFVIGLIAV